MKKVYHSKIGLELVIPLVLVIGSVLVFSLYQKPSWLGIIVLLPLILFIAYTLATTKYILDEGPLQIKSGFLFQKRIEVNSIKKLEETWNPLSSLAASLDRLEITCIDGQSVLISPKRKAAFIQELRNQNPGIEVKLRAK